MAVIISDGVFHGHMPVPTFQPLCCCVQLNETMCNNSERQKKSKKGDLNGVPSQKEKNVVGTECILVLVFKLKWQEAEYLTVEALRGQTGGTTEWLLRFHWGHQQQLQVVNSFVAMKIFALTWGGINFQHPPST